MQYKIPIQVENEDPIVFGLSIRQLLIIFAWIWLGYGTYNSLYEYIWEAAATLPALLFVAISLAIALFRFSEMTFMVFFVSMLRYWVNYKERYWQKWVDSFSALDIWYIVNAKAETPKINVSNKQEKLKNLEEQLQKI